MTAEERQTWAWYARWATIVRAYAVAEREGCPPGPNRLRRARRLLDPRATDQTLDALVAHLQAREAMGESGAFDPPRLVDLVGPAMAQRIIDAGLIDGAVAVRELEPAGR
jgi:hypothetical protein